MPASDAPPGSAGEAARYCGDPDAAGSVRLVELADGPGRGVRVAEVRTGSGLAFDVVVDRALDIGHAEHAGRAFGWRSATGVRSPFLDAAADEGGFGPLRSFTGLLVTGGLDHTFGPETVDAAQFAHAGRRVQAHPLHGRIARQPARLLQYGRDDGGVLVVEGEVRQAAVFGEHLVLRRRVEADVGGDEIRVVDTVTNAGFEPAPHMFLHHVNLGWPLLRAGARTVGTGLAPGVLDGPRRGVPEEVTWGAAVPGDDGVAAAGVLNDQLGLGVLVRWRPEQFPVLVRWAHLREGAYALGIEPSTHSPDGDGAARHAGTMIWLEPGEQRRYTTAIGVLTAPLPDAGP